MERRIARIIILAIFFSVSIPCSPPHNGKAQINMVTGVGGLTQWFYDTISMALNIFKYIN